MDIFKTILRSSLAAALWSVGAPAWAAGTAAGTAIQNSAQLSYEVGGSTLTGNSNAVTLTVAEIINVDVTALSSSVSVSAGAANQVLPMRVTNTGNGPEQFQLVLNNALTGDDFDPVAASPSIYFDTDGSNSLTSADTAYAPGGNDPTLAADASLVVLVVNNIPTGLADGTDGNSQLVANAFTGTGAAGTVFAGQGVGGADAVLGTTGGTSSATAAYVVGAIQLNSVKSQSVLDPFGGTQPVPNATLTYQIVITPSGTGTAGNVLFRDDIPVNTTYVANSLRLNGGALSDTADADAGQYLTSPAAQVRVALGNLTQASGPQTVSFQVTID